MMDPNIQVIILGIITNAFSSLFTQIGRTSKKHIIGKELLKKLEREKTSLHPILKKAADKVSEGIEWDGPTKLEEVCLFLTSPEAEAIVRQIFSAKLSLNEYAINLKLIKKEFIATFGLYVGLPEEKLKDSAKYLFNSLIEGCELAINVAIDDGILSAHEAKSAYRYMIIRNELSNIKRNLDFLSLKQKPNIQEYLDFEKKYRAQVANRHGHIIPPHFDEVHRLPIEDLYVNPSFITVPKRKEEESQIIDTKDFLSNLHRAVLLGNPGGGKSTFASKLNYDLSKYYQNRIFANRLITPILVVLRDYGAEKKAQNCSILQFIEITANTKYQVRPPSDAFEYFFLNGRAMVIFDGLDELLDTRHRQEISGDIEAFCHLFPATPVLVTSRLVGYEQAPLDINIFNIFRLAPFNDEQVLEYIKKWFATGTELTPAQQEQKSDSLYRESKIVADLRSNPLMLALMCNIYRGENYIPRNRPDLYEKCAIMLFERWDKSRGIQVELPFVAHISPTMKFLAHWIYSNEKIQSGVTERNLIIKTKEYLYPRRFDDPDEAEKAAKEFVTHCRGRAWVFTDTGTTKDGEGLFQFTHRTFLEYFTAAYLIRNHPTPDTLITILMPRISKREWDVVAQLAFQLQNKNVEGAGDKLLTMLLKRSNKVGSRQRWNLLSFATRCLEFIVPSPKITQDITIACIEYCLNFCTRRIKRVKEPSSYYHRNETPEELLNELFSSTNENWGTISRTIEKTLVDKINSESKDMALLAAEIGLHLNLAIHHSPGAQRLQQSDIDFWISVSDRIFKACLIRIKSLCPEDFPLCLATLWRGELSLQELIKWHGIECIFDSAKCTAFRATWVPIAGRLIYPYVRYEFQSENEKEKKMYSNLLKEIGDVICSSQQPWIEGKTMDKYIFDWILNHHIDLEPKPPSKPLTLNKDVAFGLFALLATLIEMQEKRNPPYKYTEKIEKSEKPIFNLFRWLFIARFKREEIQKAHAELNRLGFQSVKKAFVIRWLRKEFNMVLKKSRIKLSH